MASPIGLDATPIPDPASKRSAAADTSQGPERCFWIMLPGDSRRTQSGRQDCACSWIWICRLRRACGAGLTDDEDPPPDPVGRPAAAILHWAPRLSRGCNSDIRHNQRRCRLSGAERLRTGRDPRAWTREARRPQKTAGASGRRHAPHVGERSGSAPPALLKEALDNLQWGRVACVVSGGCPHSRTPRSRWRAGQRIAHPATHDGCPPPRAHLLPRAAGGGVQARATRSVPLTPRGEAPSSRSSLLALPMFCRELVPLHRTNGRGSGRRLTPRAAHSRPTRRRIPSRG